MTLAKKLLCTVMSLSIAVSGMTAVCPVAASAISLNFDEDDYVDEELFYINGEEWNDDVIERIEKAARCDYDDLTYKDLEKVVALDLSGLELEGIPPIVQYMFNLRTLDLSENLLLTENVANLDLSYCDELISVDISNNYLVKTPSWFVALDITSKDISNNLIGTDDQRAVQLNKTAYYYVVGDTVDENELKDKILATLELSDGTSLPKYFYNPNLPTYDIDDPTDTHNENVKVEMELSKFVDKDGKVVKTGVLTGTAGLKVVYENQNTSAEFDIYFLDGNSPSTLREQLEVLISECDDLEKGDYTTTSWANYESAKKTAQAIFDYTSADKDMLRNALDSLRRAVDSLVEGVNSDVKKTISSLLSIAKSYKEDDYSTASWEVFKDAMTALESATKDTDTTIYAANTAIKDFQRAQLALAPTLKKVPAIIPQNRFEAIYGDDETVTASGVTRGGNKYTVSFNGNDVTAPANFNPEIVCESANEASIRFEAGSASDYKIISFITTGAFPGSALVKIDVSDVYTKGVYNLYKWDNSAKKSAFVKEVVVTDGYAVFTVDSGGDYYISTVLQNFRLVASGLDINHEKLTIMPELKDGFTVGNFRKHLQNGDVIEIRGRDGKTPYNSAMLATGMTVSVPNSGVYYTVVVPGDCDGDGMVSPKDAVEILRAMVEYEGALATYEAKLAADLNHDEWVRPDDAVLILKHCVGL